MSPYFEVFDRMLEEIQQLRLDAIYFTKSTSRVDGRVERLRERCKRYEERFVRKPLERYARRIVGCRKEIRRLLRSNCRSAETVKGIVSELRRKCEELCSGARAPFDLERPMVSYANCVVNAGEMGDNEHVYCRCNRPAFKSMIACDSVECKTRWFHFECAGISSVPKTPWTCVECRKAATLTG